MKPLKSSGIWLGMFFPVLFIAVSARPAGAQGFSGFYQVTSAVDQGDGTTQVTLSVDLANTSASDAVNATVTLGDSVNPVASYGSYAPTTVNSGTDVVLTAQFIVPNPEYARWGSGGVTPNLTIQFVDSDSNPETDSVVLTQAPVASD